MRHLHQPSMLGWRASHGSGGLRPPAASRSRRSLLPAATPRMMGLSAMASLWTSVPLLAATCIRTASRFARELSSLEVTLAPSNADARVLKEVPLYEPPKAHHAGGRRGKKRPTGATGGGGRQPPEPCAARQAIMIAWPGWRMRHPAEPAHARAPSKQSSVLGKAQ